MIHAYTTCAFTSVAIQWPCEVLQWAAWLCYSVFVFRVPDSPTQHIIMAVPRAVVKDTQGGKYLLGPSVSRTSGENGRFMKETAPTVCLFFSGHISATYSRRLFSLQCCILYVFLLISLWCFFNLSLLLSGQRPSDPEDSSVATGLFGPQQVAREGHAASPADGLCLPWGHEPPAYLQIQPGHLRPHPWSPAASCAPRAGRLHGWWWPWTPSGE